MRGQTPGATPLLLPGGIAFDAQGNLYVAETGAHRIRRVDSTGSFTTVAGTGVQGFGGDGGPATAALLDSPVSVALDAAGNLYVADSHNRRVRRIDAATSVLATVAGNGAAGSTGDGGAAVSASLDLPTAVAVDRVGNLYIADGRSHRIRRVAAVGGTISTVAGNGVQGFGGDGGPATAASLDSPGGLAVDAAGNLFVADSHNQRLRRVDASTQTITTVAGVGSAGFSGDAGKAVGAALNLPRGVTLDAVGNIFVADLRNHRIRRIDAASGAISTVAGEGTELFAGDGTPAVTASLDSPRGVAVSPTGLATLSDTADQRIRQVDAAAIIHTIGGSGGLTGGTLSLLAPASTIYGTGTVAATLTSSPATGSVAFFDTVGGIPSTTGVAGLAGNAALFSLAGLSAGAHLISAIYGGDALHASARSATVSIMVTPAPLTATVTPVAMLYGQAVPALTGSAAGLLAQDAGRVSVIFGSAATSTSAPGIYPISASLAGEGAGNYSLTFTPANVTVGPAPTSATLTLTPVSASVGSTVSVAMHVASSTSGTPTGTIRLLDGGLPVASATLGVTGDAMAALSSLAVGTHALTAVYAGDGNFLTSTSLPAVETIGVATSPDFTLAATGPSSQTVVGGSAAVFSFSVTQSIGLASPIVLSVSGLPVGTTVSFSPALLPPGIWPTGFTLTVQTLKTALLERHPLGVGAGVLVAALLLPLFRGRRRAAVCLALVALLAGCGARVKTAGSTSVTLNLPVTATATSPAGVPIIHSVTVTLVVQ